MSEFISKIVRVENVPLGSISEKRVELVEENKKFKNAGAGADMSNLIQKYNEYIEVRATQPGSQIVIFDSLRVSIPG